MSKWVEGGGSWKGHESGQAVFIFLAASPLVRPARQNRHATQATDGLNSFSYFSAKQWNALPDFFRTSFFADFKTKIQDVTFV